MRVVPDLGRRRLTRPKAELAAAHVLQTVNQAGNAAEDQLRQIGGSDSAYLERLLLQVPAQARVRRPGRIDDQAAVEQHLMTSVVVQDFQRACAAAQVDNPKNVGNWKIFQ